MTADPALDPIDTERLRLRRSVPGDAEEISVYRSDPNVNRYQGWERTDPDGVRAEIREMAAPITSTIRNAYIDFSKMTVSVVAVITDVVRDGRPVIGYGFNSNGRYAPSGLIRERFIPRLIEADADPLLTDDGSNLDPHKIWAVMMTGEKPGGHGERSVAVGTIDMAVPATAVIGNFVPEVQILDIPFLFRDIDHAYAVLEGPIGQEMLAKFPEKGLVGLALGGNGFRQLTNSKHPVNSPADLHGLKLRTMENQTHLMVWRELGALPTPMALPEVFTALPQGAAAGYGSYIVGQAARYYFEHGASWGQQGPKRVVTRILENTDKQSVLQRLKEEIKKKISMNRYAGK